ncbi:uncharacterized protein LOC115987663 [Quercus lobata]|uniref:uncharacterized protein LOC115987663 n=1 Tax=Quercus lobata TaxID=97700 RepID=UPI001248AC64|nr:uncharacterized protein LOC115987663 [Quercus lobata]
MKIESVGVNIATPTVAPAANGTVGNLNGIPRGYFIFCHEWEDKPGHGLLPCSCFVAKELRKSKKIDFILTPSKSYGLCGTEEIIFGLGKPVVHLDSFSHRPKTE